MIMNGAYKVLQYTASGVGSGVSKISGKAKNYSLAVLTPLAARIATSKIVKQYIAKSKDKNSVIFAYFRWSKDVAYVVIVLFWAFAVVKVFRKFTQWKYDRDQYYIQKLVQKRLIQQEQEDDDKFKLLKEIFENDLEYTDPRLRSKHDHMLLNESEVDLEDTTNHWSCKYGDDECFNWHNGNISEVSYWNDVISNNQRENPTHNKMLEYLGNYIHNNTECDKMKTRNGKRYLHKQIKKFKSKFNQYRDKVLIDEHSSSLWPENELNEYSYNQYNEEPVAVDPHKVCHIAKSKKECKTNVNFFEILSLFADQYTNDGAKLQN